MLNRVPPRLASCVAVVAVLIAFAGAPALACGQAKANLQSLAQTYEKDVSTLPPGDAEDTESLPQWFRVYLRKNLPGLPTSSRPQYPRQATDLLRWIEKTPSFSQQELAQKVRSLRSAVPATTLENEQRSKYPKEWEVSVPAATKLDLLRRKLDQQFSKLPPRDLEDRSPFPIWFRVHLRNAYPDLARVGPYQYPRVANRILQRFLDNPDSADVEALIKAPPQTQPQAKPAAAPRTPAAPSRR